MTRARSRYLLLIVFVGLMAAPPWATTALVGLALASAAYRAGRFIATRLERGAGESEPAIVLGRGTTGRQASVAERELAAHGLILGASGSGKTTALMAILRQQISRGRR